MTSLMNFSTLDATVPGRLTQAGIVGVQVALPDYVHSRLGRFALTTLLTVGGTGLAAYLNVTKDGQEIEPAVVMDRVRQEVGDLGRATGPDSDAAARDAASPVKIWAVLLGAVLVAVLLARLEAGARRWLVRKLRDRGVAYPHTVLGGIGAVVMYAVAAYSHRSWFAEQRKAARA